MCKATWVIVLLNLLYHNVIAVTYETCIKESIEKHCIIESAVRYRWPHTSKYRYSHPLRDCIMIRWSHACGASKDPNHFTTYEECYRRCGGYE